MEYAPQMYNSGAYEPLNQITDKNHDYYNSNPNNPYNMTMREPVKNTIKVRDYSPLKSNVEKDLMIYHIHKDSFELAGRVLVNPILKSDAVLAEGKVL
ncbi:MAG: cytochrome c, partial [Cytophagales bacterium]|nr:cytochrome c [Cytophagales bacterium]